MNKTLDYYEKQALALQTRYESADMDEVQKFCADFFVSGARILEFGCGSGRDAAFLLSRGCNIISTDGSKAMLNEAEKHHPELKGRLRQLVLPDDIAGFETDSFDGILAIAVLMHLRAPEIILSLQHFHRLLNESGRAVISVPSQRKDVDSSGFDDKGRCFTMLSPEKWRLLFSDAGFIVQRELSGFDGLNRPDVLWCTFGLCKK
jgi:SAM-dependent methyltransferase